MLVKIIIVFLLAMVAIGMIGKVLFPGAITRSVTRRMPGQLKTARCGACGREVVGTKPCVCGKG
jgi:hypothetical protein